MKMTGKHDGMALAERVRNALGNNPDVTEKKMTGGICFLLRELKRWIALAERHVEMLPPKKG